MLRPEKELEAGSQKQEVLPIWNKNEKPKAEAEEVLKLEAKA